MEHQPCWVTVKGFAALLKKEITNLKITHCFLHRHALAAKTLPPDLRKILEISVKVVNMIRGRALNHRLFQSFCEEVGKEHTVLLYHTEVRWLSRGRVLSRLFELRDEIQQFLREAGHELAEYFDGPKFFKPLPIWLMCSQHSMSSTGLCREGELAFWMHARSCLLKEKLLLWIRRVKKLSKFSFF